MLLVVTTIVLEQVRQVRFGLLVQSVVKVEFPQRVSFGVIHLVGVVRFLSRFQNPELGSLPQPHAAWPHRIPHNGGQDTIGSGGVADQFVLIVSDRAARAIVHQDAIALNNVMVEST